MLNGAEIIIILLVITIVVGPQRLPQYAEQLARLVRTLRDMARGATQTIKDELGPEAADLDFSKLDPRQYAPRRIVDRKSTRLTSSHVATACARRISLAPYAPLFRSHPVGDHRRRRPATVAAVR